MLPERRTVALIVGKFLPPHRGHRYLAEAARELADDVIVCLLANSAEPISVETRHAWLEEILPWAHVRSSVANHPIDYADPVIHDLGAATIKTTIGRDHVDVLVTSEPAYGDEFAGRLGARHMLLDSDRCRFPVSETLVRQDPTSTWSYLDALVRRWSEAQGLVSTAPRPAHESLGWRWLRALSSPLRGSDLLDYQPRRRRSSSAEPRLMTEVMAR